MRWRDARGAGSSWRNGVTNRSSKVWWSWARMRGISGNSACVQWMGDMGHFWHELTEMMYMMICMLACATIIGTKTRIRCCSICFPQFNFTVFLSTGMVYWPQSLNRSQKSQDFAFQLFSVPLGHLPSIDWGQSMLIWKLLLTAFWAESLPSRFFTSLVQLDVQLFDQFCHLVTYMENIWKYDHSLKGLSVAHWRATILLALINILGPIEFWTF